MTVHIDRCPDCWEYDAEHPLDPSRSCPHRRELYEPTVLIPLDELVEELRTNDDLVTPGVRPEELAERVRRRFADKETHG